MSHTNPLREQFKALYSLAQDRPIGMLNLLRFREHALYDEADATAIEVSGREAYERYSAGAEEPLRLAGGRQLWLGRPVLEVIGPLDESWDLAFVALYPSVRSFVDMVKSAAYQEAARHRTAALSDSRLIGCWELQAGAPFAPLSYGSAT
jgi:uncharacterized protein (DUF1330 family)